MREEWLEGQRWTEYFCVTVPNSGMNAAVRAVTRMGIYVGAKVYLIYEVNESFVLMWLYFTLGIYTLLI